MQQIIMVDPDMQACSLTQGNGFHNAAYEPAYHQRFITWHEKLFDLSTVWDPRSNTTEKIASPFDPKVHQWGMVIHGDTMYYFDGTSLYAGPPGKKPSKLSVSSPSRNDQIDYYNGQLNDSNIFGLIADYRYQLLLTDPKSGLGEPAVLNFKTWRQHYVAASPE
jgi:hypothetical protein